MPVVKTDQKWRKSSITLSMGTSHSRKPSISISPLGEGPESAKTSLWGGSQKLSSPLEWAGGSSIASGNHEL